MAQEPETSDEPIFGNVMETEWIDDGQMVATIEKDGEVWYETYEFVQAEKGE